MIKLDKKIKKLILDTDTEFILSYLLLFSLAIYPLIRAFDIYYSLDRILEKSDAYIEFNDFIDIRHYAIILIFSSLLILLSMLLSSEKISSYIVRIVGCSTLFFALIIYTIFSFEYSPRTSGSLTNYLFSFLYIIVVVLSIIELVQKFKYNIEIVDMKDKENE